MQVLCVAPVAEATGETLTAISAAQDLVDNGHSVAWLVSPRADALVPQALRAGPVLRLSRDRQQNLAIWKLVVGTPPPDLVVFADYPMFFLSGTACPLWDREQEAEFIGDIALSGRAVTFDHIGLTQLTSELRLGPAPFEELLTPSALPVGMRVLLPCPLHEPQRVEDRLGIRCRGRPGAPSLTESERATVRDLFQRSNQDHNIVLHAVPGWACQLARMLGSNFHRELVRGLIDVLPDNSTIVSVNDGSLLPPSHRETVGVVNRSPLSATAFDALLGSVDLFVTDNPISTSLGRAVSSNVASAVVNSWGDDGDVTHHDGAEYDLFPIFPRGELQKLCVSQNNSANECFIRLDLTDRETARDTIGELLTSSPTQQRMSEARHRYNAAVQRLPSAGEAIAETL